MRRDKPVSFEVWLSKTQKEITNRYHYQKAHPLLRQELHNRYNNYLKGWEQNKKPANAIASIGKYIQTKYITVLKKIQGKISEKL